MSLTAKKTRILATIGPASRDQGIIENLLKNGANVFRLNFSHGAHADHARSIALIKAASKATGLVPAILADLQGPKIRTGKTPGDRVVTIQGGSLVNIHSKPIECDETNIFIEVEGLLLHNELKIGDKVLINDGAIPMVVEAINKDAGTVSVRALNTGVYSSRKGVNFPHANLSVPSLTVKDRADLEYIMTQDVDYVALSFVRCAKDLIELRDILKANKVNHLRIIAKIEKPEAIPEMDAILDYCEGIMVARGDLGVEVPIYQVPVLQKDITRQTTAKGKSVIVATQMLESMVGSLMPTRAEATDVANAILDGTDAVMLSAETASGSYPAAVVEMMSQIIKTTEASSYYEAMIQTPVVEDISSATHAACNAAATASKKLGGAPIVVFTLSGDTAWYLSKLHPAGRILAFSPDPRVVSQLGLAWNTTAFEIPLANDVMELILSARKHILAEGIANVGDPVVIVHGFAGARGETNSMTIRRIGQD